MATLQAVTDGAKTDPAAVDQAVATLQRVSQSDPTRGDTAWIIARARIEQGRMAAARGNSDQARAFYEAADKVMDDAVKAVESSLSKDGNTTQPVVRAGAAHVFWRMAELDEIQGMASDFDVTVKAKYFTQAHDREDRALALVGSDDPDMVAIAITGENIDLALGSRTDALKLMKNLYTTLPDDQFVRLEYARLLATDPGATQGAIAILELPQAPDEGQKGDHIRLANDFKLRTDAELATMYITEIDSVTDADQKQKLIGEAQAEYGTLFQAWGENLETLKLKGKIALVQNRGIDAVQALSRALTTIAGADRDDELLQYLGRAYEMTHQDTRAQQCYAVVVSHHPDYFPALVRLTRLLIRHNDATQAAGYLANLELHYPDNVDVITLRLSLLDMDRANNKDQIDRYFARVPETTDAERLEKIQLAAGLGKSDDMVRLLKVVIANEPHDISAAISLAKLYAKTGDIEASKRVIANALATDPGSADLRIYSVQLNGGSAEDVLKLRRQIYGDIADPFQRDVKLADANQQAGDLADAESELKEAAGIKPEDGGVWAELFNIYIRQSKLDDASACISHLKETNEDQAGGHLYEFRLAMARKNYGTALNVANQLIADLPALAGSWLCKGQVDQALGKYDEAIGDYLQCRTSQSDNPVALTGLVQCNYAVGHNDEALSYIQDAVKAYPEDPKWLEMEIQHFQKYGPSPADKATRLELIEADIQLANVYVDASSPQQAEDAIGDATKVIAQCAVDNQAVNPDVKTRLDDVQKKADELLRAKPGTP
jgi:tetratricopeptide (TPR) repeat protein